MTIQKSEQNMWAIFVSGSGTNLQTLIDHPELIKINCVVSDKIHCLAVERARKANIELLTLQNPIDWGELTLILKKRGIAKIFLLGFMRILPREFVENWRGKIINLHPSVLPQFPGLQAFEKSYEAGAAMGATVHEVIAELDAGPIVLQKIFLEKAITGSHQMSIEETRKLLKQTEHELVKRVVIEWKP